MDYKEGLKDYMDTLPFVMPENSSEEFWQMSGRYEALRSYLKQLALRNAEKGYLRKPLDDDLEMVCAIAGFTDVLAIRMEDSNVNDSV